MFYQLRNAFAHNPFNPEWSVKGKYHGVYEVALREATITFDGSANHSKQIKLADIGGLEGYVLLLKFAHEVVSVESHSR